MLILAMLSARCPIQQRFERLWCGHIIISSNAQCSSPPDTDSVPIRKVETVHVRWDESL